MAGESCETCQNLGGCSLAGVSYPADGRCNGYQPTVAVLIEKKKAIRSKGGSIVPEWSISRIAKSGDCSIVYTNKPNYGDAPLDFDETPDELAKLLGWEVVNAKPE